MHQHTITVIDPIDRAFFHQSPIYPDPTTAADIFRYIFVNVFAYYGRHIHPEPIHKISITFKHLAVSFHKENTVRYRVKDNPEVSLRFRQDFLRLF